MMRRYSPIAKAKKNDIAALCKLSDLAKSRIKPLLETPMEAQGNKLSVDVAKSTATIIKGAPNFPIYFDPSALSSPRDQLLGFNSLATSGVDFTPVFSLDRKSDLLGARLLLYKYDLGASLRLGLEDLQDPEEAWLRISNFTKIINLEPSRIDLILDFRHVGSYEVSSLTDCVIDFLAQQPASLNMGEIVVCGSSALQSVAGIQVDGLHSVSRVELKLWATSQFELGESRGLNFGDYGIVHPDFSFSGGGSNANAKIRYTYGANILYFRGHGLYNPNRFDQYHSLAGRVASSEYYLGAGTSFGDAYILDCAGHLVGPGNLGTWVMVDNNHHFELTSRQIILISEQLETADDIKQVEDLVSAAF